MDTRLLPVLGVATLAGVSGCSPSASQQSALARTANIDQTAPIVADQSISIDAPVPVVWRLITQIDKWPEWQPSIKATKFDGRVVAGQPFEWDNDGTKISSKIELVRPLDTIVWTGSAMGLKAVHVWKLTLQPNGGVLVQTSESMRGFPSSLFYASSDLRGANADWLKALKIKAEAGMRIRRR